LYGVPLHVWGEKAFIMITKPWGKFIGMDDETRQRFRFDVARVKISTSVRDAIDTTVSIMVQGVKYEVRVMEEGGGPLEFVHFTREEDQLGWSAAVSSCDSVGRASSGGGGGTGLRWV
jgi:hypothetical protein